MELPDNPSSDYLSYINNEKEQLLIESTTCLNNMRDYLERNVFCNAIGGNFQDIIESLTPENMLNYSNCEVSAKRVIKMIKELIKYISQSNLSTDQLIDFTDYLLNLTSSQGIILPFAFTGNSSESLSMVSLESNIYQNFTDVKGTSAERNEYKILWHQFADKMTNLAKKSLCDNPNPVSIQEIENFGKLIEILTLFNSTFDSWKIYKEARQLTFDQKTRQNYSKLSDLSDLSVTLQRWTSLSQMILDHLSVDCRFINLLFIDISNAQEAVLNFYLDFTAEEIRKFTEQFVIISKINTSSSTFTSTTFTSANKDQSNKAASFKSSKRTNVKIKVSSESAEENKTDVSDSFSAAINESSVDLRSQISAYLQKLDNFLNLVGIVGTFARIEYRIDSLLNNQWSTPLLGVNISSNINSTKKPKGVLKKIRRPSRLLSNEADEYRIPGRNATPCVAGTGQDTSGTSPVFEEQAPTYVPCLEWQVLIRPLLNALCSAFQYHMTLKFELLALGTEMIGFFIEPLNQPAPAKASKSLQDYLKFIEQCLSLILLCNEPPVDQLLTTFTKSMRSQFAHIYVILQQQAVRKLPLDITIYILSDSMALQIICSLFNNLFKPKSEEIGVYFFERKKMLSDYQKLYTKQIVDRCYNELVSSVLQDAKSNFWSDIKEFHENQRVGYPIQAWHVYLEHLWTILVDNCSQIAAREILAEVLSRSLEFLVQRYAAARPSKRRIPQARADMLAIFHIVEYNLYKIADNVDDLFGYGEDLSKLRKIHFACISLLQVFLVLTAPIAVIYDYFGDGFKKYTSKLTKSYCNSYWLSLIKPQKYDTSLTNYKGMKSVPSELSSFVVLELFLESKQFETTRMIEVLCHDKMSLITLVLQHLAQQSITDPQSYHVVKRLFVLFYRAIIRITDPFNHLHVVVVGIINKMNGWSEFHNEGDGKAPVWLAALYEIIQPYTESIVDLIVQHTTQQQRHNLDLNLTLFPDGLLPCGCELSDTTVAQDNENQKSYLREVTESICRYCLNLPISIQLLMAKLQEHLTASSSPSNNVQMIGQHVVFDCFMETIRLALINTAQITDVQTVWMTIVTHLEENENLYSNKEMVLNIYNKILEDNEISPFQEITENRSSKSFFLGMQFNHITSKSEGLNDLKVITEFLKINKQNLKCILHALNNSQEQRPSSSILFDISLDRHSSDNQLDPSATNNNSTFDPIQSFDMLGNDKFDHEHYYKMELPWDQLCTSDLGLSEIALETILSNRWQIEAVKSIASTNDQSPFDNEADQSMIESLIERYGIRQCSENISGRDDKYTPTENNTSTD